MKSLSLFKLIDIGLNLIFFKKFGEILFFPIFLNFLLLLNKYKLLINLFLITVLRKISPVSKRTREYPSLYIFYKER